ncbi:MAG: response regulator, partial [Oscillospiraceae bacterium]|nr:response regulator [Oscillospiraceae bacterium]
SGRECIEMAEKKRYDIIFMDYMMPGMNGIDTLKKLNESENNLNVGVPVIMLTANAVAGMDDVYRSAGFDDYLSKPINPHNLESVIMEYLPEEKITAPKENNEDNENNENEENRYDEPDGAGESPDMLEHLKSKIPDIDIDTAISYCGDDKDLYCSLLKNYCTNGRKESLEKFFEANDWENYRVEIHALKSTSRTLGLNGLGLAAEKLENAAKENNIGYIKENHSGVLQRLAEIIGYISD